jgi:exodeoxyribonuclease VII small subunit
VSEQSVSELSFEEAMAELEKVVSRLESGAVPLDESIRLYERGTALKAQCDARLKAAEDRISTIIPGPDGQAKALSESGQV